MIARAAIEQFLLGLMNSASLCDDDDEEASVIITLVQQTASD